MKEKGQFKWGTGRSLRKADRRGHAVLFFVLTAPLIITVLAMCVDVSLRRLISSELQTASDAAAIAGAESLAEVGGSSDVNVAANEAYNTATTNQTTLGQIAPGLKTEVGAWDADARTFGAATIDSPANAVRITATRSAQTNNSIPSIISQLFDNGSKVSTRTAIARVEKVPDYALIGLDRFTARGVLIVTGAPYAANQGSIASNGDVTLNLLGVIGVTLMDGEIATRGTVNAPSIGILTKVAGGIRKPAKPFVLPPVSVDAVKLKNDNANLGNLLSGSGDLNIGILADIPGGTYYVENLNVLTGALARFKGPTTIFVNKNVNVVGAVQVFGSDAANLKIRVAGTGTVNIAANIVMTADIYAPQSAATMLVGVIYNGRLIAKTIDVFGTGIFNLRPYLPQPELGRSRVAVVQ